jgi:hypothetical protein
MGAGEGPNRSGPIPQPATGSYSLDIGSFTVAQQSCVKRLISPAPDGGAQILRRLLGVLDQPIAAPVVREGLRISSAIRSTRMPIASTWSAVVSRKSGAAMVTPESRVLGMSLTSSGADAPASVPGSARARSSRSSSPTTANAVAP